MKRYVPRMEQIVEWIMALALAIMVVMIGGNVLLRYAFHTGMPSAEELSRLMFVWLIFLGAILALGKGAHLGMEIFQAKLPKPIRRACAVISHLLVLFALWLFLKGSWDQTLIGLDTFSTVLGFPMALMASGGLVCAAVMIVITLFNLFRILTNHPDAKVSGETKYEFSEEVEIAIEKTKAETKQYRSKK